MTTNLIISRAVGRGYQLNSLPADASGPNGARQFEIDASVDPAGPLIYRRRETEQSVDGLADPLPIFGGEFLYAELE